MTGLSALRGSKCLVTGGVGFFGSHLVRRLLTLGADVSTLDSEAAHEATALAQLTDLADVRVITQDAAGADAAEYVRSWAPDYVFHLAGIPYAPYTSIHQEEAYAANVISTRNMLSASIALHGCHFLLASSACVFGATTKSPLRVGDAPSAPEHYYTRTKQAAEREVAGYADLGTLRTSVCRFGNIYGPADRHLGRIVPRIALQLAHGQQLKLSRSAGASVFEFLYVTDAVEGMLLAAASKIASPVIWHFTGGPNTRSSVRSLAERMSLNFDGKARNVSANVERPEKEVRKYLDDSMSREMLGFSPSVDLEDGLKTVLNWYVENRDGILPKLSALGLPPA